MKRRTLLKTAAALPAAAAAAPAQTSAPSSDNIKVDLTGPDAAAQPVAGFFTTDQLKALRALAALVSPSFNDRPGADDAGVGEFLDFYVSKSGVDRQKLYRAGLDRLNTEARKRHAKDFAALTADQAAPILAPLTAKWTYNGPADPLGQFLIAAKEDILRATVNSRPYVTALSQTSRGGAGTGYYWLPVE